MTHSISLSLFPPPPLAMSLHSLCKVLFARFLYGTMLHRLAARVLYIPTVIRLLLKQKVSFYNWYDRIDDTVILGALPFRSMTKEVSTQPQVIN